LENGDVIAANPKVFAQMMRVVQAHLSRPSAAEMYSPERKAELLLNNAVDAQDYKAARETVR
jgi:hypothetical protein